MRRNKVEIKSIEYDVSPSVLKTQPDLEKLVEFCSDGKHRSMCMEYNSNEEAKRRRRVLQAWIKDSDLMFYTRVKDNKLYVFREGDKV